jgi:3-deoxy-7-phosphoheptulonate synthase
VTECVGGAEKVLDSQLDDRYETMCDPRLNGRQAIDLAFEVSDLLRT